MIIEWTTGTNKGKAMEGNIVRYTRDRNKSSLSKPLAFILYIVLTITGLNIDSMAGGTL